VAALTPMYSSPTKHLPDWARKEPHGNWKHIPGLCNQAWILSSGLWRPWRRCTPDRSKLYLELSLNTRRKFASGTASYSATPFKPVVSDEDSCSKTKMELASGQNQERP
jgi:hypothetical protein